MSGGRHRGHPARRLASLVNDHTGMVSALEIVAALDRAWQSIRARHPEVPPVVLLLGPSPSRAGARFRTHGCYLGAGWTLREAQLRSDAAMKEYHRAVARLDPSEGLQEQLVASVEASHHAMAGLYGELASSLPEVFIATELIAAGANEMFKVLLHEAVHAIAQARGIKDTSRQGRYHNARFRALAQEAGLEPKPRDPVIGFSPTTLTATAAQEYETALGELSAALAGQAGPQDRAAAAAARGPVCECGAWLPMTRRRIEPVAGTVMCRTCGGEP